MYNDYTQVYGVKDLKTRRVHTCARSDDDKMVR